MAPDRLGELGLAAQGAAPALIEALKDQDQFVRISAAKTLGKLGTAATTAVPTLVELLKDQVALVRASAADALGQIGRRREINLACPDPAAA
jgi:HEAT repeat protein